MTTASKPCPFDDRYVLTDRIGVGGMSEVYRALDWQSGLTVAIKFLAWKYVKNLEIMRQFALEYEVGKDGAHPNLCQSFEKGSSKLGRPFIVMEFLKGRTLCETLQVRRFDNSELLSCAESLLRALRNLHNRGFIHRDLKPSNIFLTVKDEIKLFDFGLVKVDSVLRRWRFGLANLDIPGCGTLSYMSPEQILCRPIDHRSDLFSLGVVLFELAAGQHPFSAENPLQTTQAILNRPAPWIAEIRTDISTEMAHLIHKLLEKDPVKRFRSADEALTEMGFSGDSAGDSRLSDPPGDIRISAAQRAYRNSSLRARITERSSSISWRNLFEPQTARADPSRACPTA